MGRQESAEQLHLCNSFEGTISEVLASLHIFKLLSFGLVAGVVHDGVEAYAALCGFSGKATAQVIKLKVCLAISGGCLFPLEVVDMCKAIEDMKWMPGTRDGMKGYVRQYPCLRTRI